MSVPRRAKLVCTLGPASDSLEGLQALIDAGMDVARLNFSHGTHADHGAALGRLRQASEMKKKSVAALQDLCGPKIRTGRFPAKFDLPSGCEVDLVEGEESSDERVIPINYEGLAGDVRVGDRILFDDGRLVLLADQDRSRWDRAAITEGVALAREALAGRPPSRFALMAAIAAVHAEATTWDDTDWAEIVSLYDLLARIWPSPVVSLNRAVALGLAHGPGAGLAALDELDGEPQLVGYPYLPAARADFLRRLGDTDAARTAYREALALTGNEVERQFLTVRLGELDA